jgi:hypothetical protein
MKAFRAARAGTSSRLFGALALVASLGLVGCSDIDDAMFGADDNGSGQAASNEPGTLSPSDGQQQVAQSQQPGGYGQGLSSGTEPGTLPDQPAAPSPMPTQIGGTMGGITPVSIEPGSNTGTAVSNTIANLRAQLMSIEDHINGNAQRLAGLHAQAGENSTAYHEAKAHITARLQAGTTRGNPELVAEWNTAQSALDQLSTNINALSTLGTNVANDSSNAHYVLDQITATFNVSGAVDEDHRQLSVLEDETNQTIILIDRVLRNVSDDVQRQTAYTANERANLTTLAGAIKNGELYGGDLGGAPMLAMSTAASASYSGTPLVVIKFDHANVEYQQILYAALSQALQTRPGSSFSVVAVSPTRGTVTAVQLAQTAAKRHAQEVMRSITDMGVPASRLQVASSTDPNATASEVRVFIR